MRVINFSLNFNFIFNFSLYQTYPFSTSVLLFMNVPCTSLLQSRCFFLIPLTFSHCRRSMNIDRRIISRGHGPSDDSGSDGEENLRASKFLKTYEQVFEEGKDPSGEGKLSLKWPSVCKVIPERIKHSKKI